MLKPSPKNCGVCGVITDETALVRCPICYKEVCHKCARSKGGKEFCSQYCAEYFFHYEED